MRAKSSCSAKPVAFATPHDAQRAGIVTIYQEFTLAPDMTIAENVFIGREPGSKLFVSWRRMAAGDEGDRRAHRAQARSNDTGARPFGRRAAAGRDRPRALDAVPAHHHGRADRGVERNRGRKSGPHRAGAEGRRPVDHFRHPSAGGGFPPLRSLHRVARRPLRRLWPRRRDQCRGDHPHDGRARRRRALRRKADPRAWEGRARGRGPDASPQRARSERDRARSTFRSRRTMARSSALRASSARAARKPRERFSAPTRSIMGRSASTARRCGSQAHATRCLTASASFRRTARSRLCSSASPSAPTSPSPRRKGSAAAGSSTRRRRMR